jgi:hypothetical protein
MTAHANLGASSAKRWINCPGSVALIEKLPEHEKLRSSKYAEEGSAAHALAEHCLSNDVFPKALIGWHITKYGEVWKVETPQTRTVKLDFFEVTAEMAEAVGEFVVNVRDSYSSMGKGVELRLETRVQPLEGRDDLFGTADVILHQPFGTLEVRDYKHGVGVVVEVDHNEQLMYYGLGALRAVGGADEVELVRVIIDQPRARHTDGGSRPFEIAPKKLEEWGDTLRAAADRTKEPNAPLHAGEWCRFCPMSGRCPEQRAASLKAAQMQFTPIVANAEPPTLYVPEDPEKLALAMQLIPMLDAWIKGVEGTVQRDLEAGKKIPGFKLVEKKSNRAWIDEAKVLEALANSAASEEDYMTKPELRSPAQIEKITALGTKKEREALVKPLAHKPPGGLTIAKDSDPRPAHAAPAIAAFATTPTATTDWLD